MPANNYFTRNYPVREPDYPTQPINYPIGATNNWSSDFNWEQCAVAIEALLIVVPNTKLTRSTTVLNHQPVYVITYLVRS